MINLDAEKLLIWLKKVNHIQHLPKKRTPKDYCLGVRCVCIHLYKRNLWNYNDGIYTDPVTAIRRIAWGLNANVRISTCRY